MVKTKQLMIPDVVGIFISLDLFAIGADQIKISTCVILCPGARRVIDIGYEAALAFSNKFQPNRSESGIGFALRRYVMLL